MLNESKLAFEKIEVGERATFYDFLHSGWKIDLTVAVDFTASNGHVNGNKIVHKSLICCFI